MGLDYGRIRPRESSVEAAYYNDLEASRAHAWSELARAAADRRHAFHQVQVATVAANGLPEVRTVILRGVDARTGTLRFHSDGRADKLAALAANPVAAVHAYDARAGLQLRLRGPVAVHADDALAEAAWRDAHAMSRVCYRMAPGPGTPLATPDGYAPGVDRVPEDGAADPGRVHFRAIVVHADMMEWLCLAAAGHRRARWERSADIWRGRWLAP